MSQTNELVSTRHMLHQTTSEYDLRDLIAEHLMDFESDHLNHFRCKHLAPISVNFMSSPAPFSDVLHYCKDGVDWHFVMKSVTKSTLDPSRAVQQFSVGIRH